MDTTTSTHSDTPSFSANRAARYTVLAMAMWLFFALVVNKDMPPAGLALAIAVGLGTEVGVSSQERRKARRQQRRTA